MEIYVRYLHNDMIKLFDNGGLASVFYSMTHKVLIIDTTLRSFIPPQLRKMTPKLHNIFGCELCIIPKDMQIGLNILRKIYVKYLQQKYIGRHTYNGLFSTTSAANYKHKFLPCDECLHADIKDSAQCITILSIKPKNIIHIKFSLGFFY